MINLYIPDELYKDIKNKEAVKTILDSAEDTSVRMVGLKTIDDVVKELFEIGEDKIAEYISR